MNKWQELQRKLTAEIDSRWDSFFSTATSDEFSDVVYDMLDHEDYEVDNCEALALLRAEPALAWHDSLPSMREPNSGIYSQLKICIECHLADTAFEHIKSRQQA